MNRLAGVVGEVESVELATGVPRGVIGRAVHLVGEFATEPTDGVDDANRVDTVAVVTFAYVTRDREEFGKINTEPRLLLELSNQSLLGGLTKVDPSAGQPPQGGLVLGIRRTYEGDRVLVSAFGAGLTWGSTVLRWPALRCDPLP